MVEKSDVGKCHGNVVLVSSLDNIVIADGTAGLGDEGNTALFGTLYIVTEWEESIGAESYAGNGLEVFLLFLAGKRLRLLSEDTLPVICLQKVLPLLRNVNINGVVAVRAAYIILEWQSQHFRMLAQMPYISLVASQTGAVHTGLLTGTDADGLSVLGVAYGVGLSVFQGDEGNKEISLRCLCEGLVGSRNVG